MEKNHTLLVDEAWVSEPIKNTLRLGWEWIRLNQKFTLSVMGIYIFLNILGAIPMLALPFMFLSGIFSLIIQIYIGKTFYQSTDIKSFVNEIEQSSVSKLTEGNIAPAVGGYLGWFSLLSGMAFFIVLFLLNDYDANMLKSQDMETLIPLFATIAIPIILLMLIFSYVQPLVQSNIIMSNSFAEGFASVYTIFSINLWKKAMNTFYFSYIVKLGFLVMGILFIASIVVGLLGMNIFSTIFIFILSYIFTIFMAMASMMLRRVVEE